MALDLLSTPAKVTFGLSTDGLKWRRMQYRKTGIPGGGDAESDGQTLDMRFWTDCGSVPVQPVSAELL